MRKMKDEESQPVSGMKEENEKKSYACDAGAILLSFTILIGAFAIPIAMIVIGTGGLNGCPAEKMIPIYLVVGGITCLLILPLTIIMKLFQSCVNKDGPMGILFKCYDGLFMNCLAVFFLAWFICGNVWVYRTSDVEFTNTASPLYCDELTYKFAYWVIIATYVCSVLSCILTACIRKRVSYDDVK